MDLPYHRNRKMNQGKGEGTDKEVDKMIPFM